MRRSILVLTLVLVGSASVQAAEKKFDFEGETIGAPPAGFEFARTGGGPEGKWVVAADKDDPKNKVLAQTSADTDGQRVLDARDGTFKEAGRVGLWTKADSVIQFDDFAVSGN